MDVSPTHWLDIAVQTPAHSGVGTLLSYRSDAPFAPGQLVRVPLGRREVMGVVWRQAQVPADLAPHAIKPVLGTLDGLPPLNAEWRQLVGFAAQYYQRALGEVALSVLPPQLRELDSTQLARRLKKLPADSPVALSTGPALSAQQEQVLAQLATQPGPFLLFGNTGSGKTEVYLRAVEALLARAPHAQATSRPSSKRACAHALASRPWSPCTAV